MTTRKPESVRRQAEAANAAIASLGNTAPEPDQSSSATAGDENNVNQPTGTPEKAPESDPPKTEDQLLDKPLGNENDPWEQRYKILQGKYNKEVPALHEKVRKLSDQLQEAGDSDEFARLRQENTELKQKLDSAGSQEQSTANNADIDKLREDYPAELVDGLLAAIQRKIDPLEQRVNSVNETVTKTNKTSNMDRLRQTLKAQDIDFDRLNKDPVFVEEFLEELAPYSNKTKGQLLNEAFEQGDINRAATFFIDYIGGRDNASSARETQQDMDKHVQVSTNSAGAPPSTDGMVWNEPTIAQFYEDKRRGKYTKEEARALEESLFASMNGG